MGNSSLGRHRKTEWLLAHDSSGDEWLARVTASRLQRPRVPATLHYCKASGDRGH